ncbi:ubiquitin carboxyl-terminal hydrolase 2 [Venturia nashicola]|uniref:Ubiquitin carboxyl-terminal hydrolase n=1 Tax=Venturia nashicola TaxID=86259 RepID=A0A4Z1P1I8_9PEZI|nr:ubiquitin carboxyl-terminal hydrolase 2 [Venturia nashicola]TLD19536.1 ubiquitin carboxyl-terminal hydrolase 2 [Venturia nashicola]
MTDTLSATPRPSATTLASPIGKMNNKAKPNPAPGPTASVAFGCEHTYAFYTESSDRTAWKLLCKQYKDILRTLREESSIKTQTIRVKEAIGDKPSISEPILQPTYFCLNCPKIYSQDLAKAHYEEKRHTLHVESRSGHIFCQGCEDFIYDPALENLRMRSRSSTARKRKLDDYSADNSPLVTGNSTFVPCRAVGLRGLYNMGQTCFMSVVIQSLLHNPYLKTWYMSDGHKQADCEKESCIGCALDEIFVEFWSAEKTEGYGAVPMLLNSWKCSEQLAGYQQQDAHEYMQFILNSLHTSSLSTVTSSDHDRDCDCIIHRTFYGKLQSIVTCDECKNKTNTPEPFMDLSLDLRMQSKKRKLNGIAKTNGVNGKEDEGLRLEECLARFTGDERLGKDDYMCHKCGKQRDATKQLSIKQLPPVLSIHLKRFSHTKEKASKLETTVAYPLSLDMTPFTTAHRPVLKKAKPQKPSATTNEAEDLVDPDVGKYILSAVIVHKGDIQGGHYVSYAREGADWFLFDDSKVVGVSEAEVLSAQAYLLVYVCENV